MKKMFFALSLVIFAISVFAQGDPKVEQRKGYITLESVKAAQSVVVVDLNLDGRVDAGHGDNVDKNFVKIKVNTSEKAFFFAVVDLNRLGFGMNGTIRHEAEQNGYAVVDCYKSAYNDNPFGIEVEPSTVRPNATMLSLSNAGRLIQFRVL